MQTPRSRTGSSEVHQKVSPRTARPLKLSSPELSSASSSSIRVSRTPKDRSPKVADRISPRSPVSVSEKKRPSRMSELESQISQLQDDLKKVKDQLVVSESSKKEAQADAKEVKRQLSEVSSKLDESQKQLSEVFASKEAHLVELQNISDEKDQAWQSQLEAVQKQQSVDSAALASALDEVQRLKLQLELVAESEDAQCKCWESTDAELLSLKEKLGETLSLMESMRSDLAFSKESEAHAQELVRETLLQLEAEKETANVLRSDGIKVMEAYNSIATELDHSKACVDSLEGLVNTLKFDLEQVKKGASEKPTGIHNCEEDIRGNQHILDVNHLEVELSTMKSEVARLKAALENSEKRHQEELTWGREQIRSAHDLVEQMKSASSLREAELEAELKKAEADIEELRANLMDKETELQGISEENESLSMKLGKSVSHQRENDLEKELKKLREDVAELRASLMDKETELQNISEENEMLKSEVKKRETDKGTAKEVVAAEVEASRAAEQEALVKLGHMMEEADKSNRKATRVAEQLEAAQAVNAEMEKELRRLKVQSDQWRKAAEAAASMLSAGSNGMNVERTGSLDSSYSPIAGRISSPYMDDYDDDSLKKKNGNMLKKIGVLWKKPQK
ncbi:hypothetical protein Ancab_008275 [Ancistrocladus abbreviatus]